MLLINLSFRRLLIVCQTIITRLSCHYIFSVYAKTPAIADMLMTLPVSEPQDSLGRTVIHKWGIDSMSEEELPLLTGRFPDISKMLKAELLEECTMWRNIWGWIPSAIKYYAARTGSQVGIQIRNYHRFLGVLLDTEWTLKGVEVGVWEKIYDQNDGQYYYERKIVKLPVGQIVAFDWIKERILEADMAKEEETEVTQ